jgi:hypothetical protein
LSLLVRRLSEELYLVLLARPVLIVGGMFYLLHHLVLFLLELVLAIGLQVELAALHHARQHEVLRVSVLLIKLLRPLVLQELVATRQRRGLVLELGRLQHYPHRLTQQVELALLYG